MSPARVTLCPTCMREVTEKHLSCEWGVAGLALFPKSFISAHPGYAQCMLPAFLFFLSFQNTTSASDFASSDGDALRHGRGSLWPRYFKFFIWYK